MTSKNPNKKSFKYLTQSTLPALTKMEEQWNLAKLYYKNEHDPKIEADLVVAEKAYSDFAKKWRNKPFDSDTAVLKKALTEYETLSGLPEVSRPGRYFGLRTCLNTQDHAAEKQLALISRRLRKAGDEILFFGLTLGKVPKNKQKEFLAEPTLKHFHYFLTRLFLGAQHHLSEPEEKIINLKSRQAYGMWTDMTQKILSNRTVTWKGKSLPLPEAQETINTIKSTDKPKLWNKMVDELEQISEVAEHEFNAIITDVRTEDELRGYKKPYSATALNYEDTEKSIESLVEAVSTKGFELSKKFYKLKAQFQGVPTLHYSQKYDSIGQEMAIPFPQAVEICRDVFYSVHNDYGTIFDNMLTRGQIDVFPKKGKQGGAFMSDQTGHPVQVLLNHLSDFKSVETLAHEMGHAIHAHRSATNTPFYDGHSIITAETASTLFENLVFDAVYEASADSLKPVLLHDRIGRNISTIQRQIAFFNTELEIHNTIHINGAMSNDELRDCMYRHLKSYLGSAIALDKRDGYSYVYIPHLRYGFYVYSYSFGLLMSTIMSNHYKADKSYVKHIDTFLRAGSSANVADIFASVGINTTKTDTFTEALKNHEADINTFALMVRQTKKG